MMRDEINQAFDRGTQRIQGKRQWESVLDAILTEFADESDAFVIDIGPEPRPHDGSFRFKRVLRLKLGELRRMKQ